MHGQVVTREGNDVAHMLGNNVFHIQRVANMLMTVLVDLAMSRYEPRKRMTPDEAMRHPWIQEHFQRPSSMDDTAPHQPIITETMVDSTSSTAQFTSRRRPRPVGAKGRKRGEPPPKWTPHQGDSF